MRILITGATGFIGKHLAPALSQQGHFVTGLIRTPTDRLPDQMSGYNHLVHTPDIVSLSAETFVDQDIVIHLAGVAHQTADPDLFQRVNVEGTRRVIAACRQAGISRLVYFSSVKVLAETSVHPLDEKTIPYPTTDYGKTKQAAEDLVLGMMPEAVVVRIPLVYATNAVANFRSLIRIATLGIPLPFATVANRRSYLGIPNLTDFVLNLIAHYPQKSRIFHVSDANSLTLPEVIQAIAVANNRTAKLFAIPDAWLDWLCQLVLGREGASKLLGALELECSDTNKALAWTAPYSMKECLEMTMNQSGRTID